MEQRPLSGGIESLNFSTDEGLGSQARIGLIVLQSDQTLEYELASILQADGVVLHHARIPNAMDVTPDTLRAMERELPRTAALLPGRFGFDAIGYGCTSGATLIGEDRVDRIIRQAHPQAKTSNPITACKAALTALGLKRIALVTPYAASVTLGMQENLEAAGFEVTAVASFNETDDFTVARIAPASVLDAVLAIGARQECDGVFVSCTNLRALPVIAEAEAQLGKPVISSNLALAWHLARQTGLKDAPGGTGRLFEMR